MLWKWIKGRQKSTDYSKFCLWRFRIFNFGFDAYILKYQENTVLTPHLDPVENGIHWRMNLGWGKANFTSAYPPKVHFKLGLFTFIVFRPDINKHSLFVFDKTIKLSFGFVKFNS